MTFPDSELRDLASEVADLLGNRTVGSAESFTAGLVAQSLASVGGSGSWFLGGIVAYQPEAKQRLLGVEAELVVTESCAIQMARGAAERLGADIALSTTGVAGPGPFEGRPPGTVIVGWSIDGSTGAATFDLAGPPDTLVRRGARTALELLSRQLREQSDPTPADLPPDPAALTGLDDSLTGPPATADQPSAEFSRDELPRDDITVVEGGDIGAGGD